MEPIFDSFRIKKCFLEEAHSLAALDIGCSLTKSIFVDKNTLEDDVYILTFGLYPNSKVKEAIEDIKRKGLLPSTGIIAVTGVGGERYKALIQEILGLEPQFQDEFKSQCAGIAFLVSNMDPEEFSQNFCPKNEGSSEGNVVPEMFKAYIKDIDPFFTVTDKYPLLYLVMGSSIQVFIVYEDGSSNMESLDFAGGLTLLGLGRLLVGTANYDELESLALKGNCTNVYTTMGEIVTLDPDSSYGRLSAGIPVFPFGKAFSMNLGIESFKREDLARSLFSMLASSAINATIGFAKCRGIRKVWIGGNMVRGEAIRQEMFMANVMKCYFTKELLDLRYLNSGHVGTLGCLLLSRQK